MNRRMLAPAVALSALGIGAVPVSAGTTKTVKIVDDYYGPAKLTVKKGTKVKWVWQAGNANSHDVRLSKGPKGAPKFHSKSASADFSFSRTLKQPGTYKIICTLHSEMEMSIKVTK